MNNFCPPLLIDVLTLPCETRHYYTAFTATVM